MTLFKTTVFLALCSTLLTACNEDTFQGSLKLSTPASFADKDGKKTLIPAGTYASSLLVGNKKGIKLRVKTKEGEKEFLFKIKGNPQDDQGNVSLPASVSGQAYDVIGGFDEGDTQSDMVSTWESCTYPISVYACRQYEKPKVCHTVTECDPHNPNHCRQYTVCTGGGYEEVCGYETEYRSGQQNVQYYYTYHSRSYKLSLLSAAQNEVGRLSVGANDSTRNTVYAGACTP